jgi:hypothetical protein
MFSLSLSFFFFFFAYSTTTQLIILFQIIDGGVAQVDASRYDPADPNLATQWNISVADPGSANYLYVLFFSLPFLFSFFFLYRLTWLESR